MTWKCLIVDDEPPALRILERFLNDIPSTEIIAKCKNVFEANEVLLKEDIDIMFLDINMPKMTGLSFIKTINKPPVIIITTAYREYAYDAYELDVIDYLKKPFSFERFFKAVNKAIDHLSSKLPAIQNSDIARCEPKPVFIFVKEDKVTYKIDINDILYIESVGDYNKVFTKKKVYIAYQTLKKLQKLLPDDLFPRVHKSYIVSLHKVDSIIGNQVKIMDSYIPIGHMYRKTFLDLVDKFR